MENNYFNELNAVNVNDKVEKKNNLSYLSWAYAWGEVKKRFPEATYTIYERMSDFGPINYFTDGRTGWVKTSVTINGIEHIEELPIMDYRNQAIFYDAITSVDVNKTIQRSLTKAIARHGLGLYVYAGEDLPEDTTKATEANEAKNAIKQVSATTTAAKPAKNVAKDAVTPTKGAVNTAELNDLIKNIGIYAKRSRTVYGNLNKYQEIVANVTGDSNFKCNIATEDDIPLLQQILALLQTDPQLQ